MAVTEHYRWRMTATPARNSAEPAWGTVVKSGVPCGLRGARHPLAHGGCVDALADGGDLAGELVAGPVLMAGAACCGVGAGEHGGVGVVQGRRAGAHHDLPGTWLGYGDPAGGPVRSGAAEQGDMVSGMSGAPFAAGAGVSGCCGRARCCTARR
ncbi:hypothetical protein EES42_24155 [Streptomyces sp. ADI95-17]|nr:hypothetical protein EES42_24155 [Streptomyces sp. ADI95-17]